MRSIVSKRKTVWIPLQIIHRIHANIWRKMSMFRLSWGGWCTVTRVEGESEVWTYLKSVRFFECRARSWISQIFYFSDRSVASAQLSATKAVAVAGVSQATPRNLSAVRPRNNCTAGQCGRSAWRPRKYHSYFANFTLRFDMLHRMTFRSLLNFDIYLMCFSRWAQVQLAGGMRIFTTTKSCCRSTKTVVACVPTLTFFKHRRKIRVRTY